MTFIDQLRFGGGVSLGVIGMWLVYYMFCAWKGGVIISISRYGLSPKKYSRNLEPYNFWATMFNYGTFAGALILIAYFSAEMLLTARFD